MIKWDGYGKLLKQSFFTLLISCFILLGSSFVSAEHFGDDRAGAIPYTVVYSNVSSTVYGTLNFSNSSGGNWLNLPADSNYHFYVFWNNGRLYNYSYIGGRNKFYRQGYFNRACKVYSDDAFLESPRCVSDNDFTTGNAAEFYGLTNYYFTKAAVYSYDDFQYPHFCFYNANNLYYYCFKGTMIDGNSLSIPDGTTSFSSYAGNSPFGNGSINGGSQEVNGGSITGNVSYSACKNKNALAWYHRKGYNDNLCYSSYDNYTEIYQTGQTYGAFALTGIDVEDLRFNTASYRRYGSSGDGMSYSDWFQYWRKSFDVYKHSDGSIDNPFVGVPVSLFTYMGNINTYGMAYNNSSILEFCDLLLYRNPDGVYSGLASNEICNINIIDSLPDGYYVESGYNVIGSSWEGITNRTRNDGKPTVIPQRGTGYSTGESSQENSSFTDGKTFENNYFNLLSENFKFSSGGGSGALPGYIVLALCGIVLFRFLRH